METFPAPCACILLLSASIFKHLFVKDSNFGYALKFYAVILYNMPNAETD